MNTELTELQKTGAEISAVEAESGGSTVYVVGVNGPRVVGPGVLRPEPFS